jgi:regulator of sigma E protease
VSFAGSKDPTWDRVDLEVGLAAPGHPHPVTVERDGKLLTLTTSNTPGEPFAVVGYPAEPTIVGRVTPDRPAAKAGLMAGDIIVAVDGMKLPSPNQLPVIIQQVGGRPTQLEVLRDGKTLKIDLTPVWGDPGDGNPRWGIGIGFGSSSIIKSYSIPEAIVKAGQFNFILTTKVIYTVGDLLTRKVSPKLLMGPLGIVQVSGEAAQVGYDALIRLMAMISLNLAVFNLLPIPILDGGHIFMLATEGLLRRDLSLKLKERVLTMGMVLLLALFLFVMFNDVVRLFPNL